MINHDHEFIFIHIPKCGGTSFETEFNCWSANKYRCRYFHVGEDKQHQTIQQILEYYPDCNHYYKFSFAKSNNLNYGWFWLIYLRIINANFVS